VNCLILLTGLLPDDPDVIVGQNLSMTCQLHSDHARDLRFVCILYPFLLSQCITSRPICCDDITLAQINRDHLTLNTFHL